jgi:cell fate regulator YaaT (PSP1 superfamily)
MKITAHELAVIIDTFNYSLKVSNWGGYYTDESREDVRNAIAEIMNKMSVEIITDKAEFTIDADAGI